MLSLKRIHWLKFIISLFIIRVSFEVLRYQVLDGDFREKEVTCT